MNTPRYPNMGTVWDDGTLAPQLELEEFGSPDPTAYAPQGAVNVADGRQTLQPLGHSPSVGAYNTAFQHNGSFSFTVQPPQQQGMNTAQRPPQTYFQSAGPSVATTSQTRQHAYPAQMGSFAGPSSIHSSPNAHAPTYTNESMYGAYPQPGAPSPGYDASRGAAHDQTYHSPHIDYTQGYAQHQQPQRQPNSPFFPSDVADGYGAPPASKRPRPEDAPFYDELPVDEKPEGLGKGDAANKRP